MTILSANSRNLPFSLFNKTVFLLILDIFFPVEQKTVRINCARRSDEESESTLRYSGIQLHNMNYLMRIKHHFLYFIQFSENFAGLFKLCVLHCTCNLPLEGSNLLLEKSILRKEN